MSSLILPHNPTPVKTLDPVHLAHVLGDAAHAAAGTEEGAAYDAYRTAHTQLINSYHRALEILDLSADIEIPNNTGVCCIGAGALGQWSVYEHQVVTQPARGRPLWSCTCTWHRNGGKPRLCKHILAVWLYRQLQEQSQ